MAYFYGVLFSLHLNTDVYVICTMCPIYAYQIKVIMYVSLRDKIVFYNWREVQYTERYDQVIMCIIIKS
jgi:hypothetical protein